MVRPDEKREEVDAEEETPRGVQLFSMLGIPGMDPQCLVLTHTLPTQCPEESQGLRFSLSYAPVCWLGVQKEGTLVQQDVGLHPQADTLLSIDTHRAQLPTYHAACKHLPPLWL